MEIVQLGEFHLQGRRLARAAQQGNTRLGCRVGAASVQRAIISLFPALVVAR